MVWLIPVLLVFSTVCAYGDPIDPDADGIGIYFDEGAGADSWCTSGTVGSQVTAYLCLTRAQDNSGFTNWEGRIESSVGDALAGFNIRGDGTNLATAPEFVVTYGTPLPWQISTVLLDITVDVLWEWSIALRIWPASVPSGGDELPAYATASSGGVYRTLGYSFGWDQGTKVPNWCASINDGGCSTGPSVNADDSSWGAVKALYR